MADLIEKLRNNNVKISAPPTSSKMYSNAAVTHIKVECQVFTAAGQTGPGLASIYNIPTYISVLPRRSSKILEEHSVKSFIEFGNLYQSSTTQGQDPVSINPPQTN